MGSDTLSREITLKISCLLSEKGSSGKMNEFAPCESKSFSFIEEPFSGGVWCAGNQI